MNARTPTNSEMVNPRRVFLLLMVYRWLSLIPPLGSLLFLLPDWSAGLPLALTLGVATALNVLISLYHDRLNQALLNRPWLLAVDLVVVAAMVALTGGWRTPYYLYALSPLLAAAFFFQLRGALMTISGFVLLYLGAVLAVYEIDGETPNWMVVVTAIVGAYLIGSAFGFASDLVQRLRTARDGLAEAHRDLEVIHDLTVSLQSAADVTEVEERVLEAVTAALGFPRAVVALVDQDEQSITAWMGRARDDIWDGGLSHWATLRVVADSGIVGQALLSGRPHLAVAGALTSDETINAQLQMARAHVFPLLLREHIVGILLVDVADEHQEAAHLQSLQAIANQAAVSLGTTMMCIDRAQRLAVQEERVRIARDIHDTVSQSLFGIVYTLDGCLKLLPQQPEPVVPELQRVLSVAEETRTEIRKSILDIWPSEMTADQFIDDLRKFVNGICQADDLELNFQVRGEFDRLSSRARRGLYRIGQEALANVSHHAAASKAEVCLEVADERVLLTVRDDGRGFDPEQAMKREYGRDHFGLWGMQERARSLGGSCEVYSQPGAGSSVMVDIPV